ncbi:MAG: DUF3592 domain-containing protein [Deltaproteobacteria bacterium]|nr:DUF3592 domain-containing protein [Deltaproteobacteria bacterium]
MNLFKFMVFLFGFVGVGFLIGTGYGYQHTKKFIATSLQAQGKVIELSRHATYDNHNRSAPVYYPVIEFTLPNGKKTEFISNTGSNPPDYEVGDSVTIIYDPAKPRQAKINSFLDIWLLPVVLGFLGTVFTTFSLCLGLIFLKQAKPHISSGPITPT